MLSLVLYVVAVGTNTRMHVMKGMDGPAFARQLSRDDSLFESGPASVPVGHVPVGHVVSAPQSLIQSGTVNQTQHSLAQYGLCNSNFRGLYGGAPPPAGWYKPDSNSVHNAGYINYHDGEYHSPYTIYGDGAYPCTNASFPICGDAEGKGMYGLYVGTEAWRSGGWSRFGKCRAGAQFTRGLMNASLNLKFFPAECGTVMDKGGSVMHTCLSEYIQVAREAIQEHAGCGDGDAASCAAQLAAAASAAAHAAITAMDSQCMAKESHLAAMGAQISKVSLAMSDVAKEIKRRMSENNVSHAANWRFVVGNASKIAGKLDEVFQRGKVLEDRAPSKAISSAAQQWLTGQTDSYIGSLDAFCEKVKNITTTAIGEDGEAGMFKLYGNTDLLQMINALEMTVREVHCVAPKCVDGEYVVQPAPSAGGSGEYNAWVAQEAR